VTNRKKIRGRTANNITTPVGKHWTITRIVSQPEGKFGFAISDDGRDTCYIPRSIIERYSMTTEDEGAGFTAPLKPGTGGGGQHPHVMNPVMFDADGEDVEELAAKLEEMGRMKTHIDHIIKTNAEVVTVVSNQIEVLNFMSGEISATMKWLEDNYPEE
jgi:hypothetical protein